MSELSFLVLPKHREELIALIKNNYTRINHTPIPKDQFLGELWRAVSIFIRNNVDNMLIRHTLAIHPNLIHQAFVVLSVWHGSRGDTPTIQGVLMEFVEMLKNDFRQVEQNFFYHVKVQKGVQYFPELIPVWSAMREIYEHNDRFDTSVLPTTAHHAFVLIANRNQKLFFYKDIEPESLYGHIHVLMRKYNNYYVVSESRAA